MTPQQMSPDEPQPSAEYVDRRDFTHEDLEVLDRLCREDPMLVRRHLRAAGCPACGGPMEHTAENAIYCSSLCRYEAYGITRRLAGERVQPGDLALLGITTREDYRQRWQPIDQRVLAVLYEDDETTATLVIERLGEHPSTVRESLTLLYRAGVVTRHREGFGPYVYRVNEGQQNDGQVQS